MNEDEKKGAPAAYLPFKTFLSSIEALDHGLPKKLDRTIWRGQSGIIQGQIMMAYRFFRLIDNNDHPTHALHDLVERKSERPQVLGLLLKGSYGQLFEHDLTKTTPKMLEEAMSSYGVQGDTRRKAVAFFLRAARYAEIPMHLLLTAQIRNVNTGSRRKRRVKDDVTADSGVPTTPVQPSSGGQLTSKTVTLPSGTTVTLHILANWLEMSPIERDYVFGLVDTLQHHPTAEDPDEEEEDAA